jgi:hypothetical protein
MRMILDTVHEVVMDMSLLAVVTATVGLLMLLGFLMFKLASSSNALPGVPELKGVPILGPMPMYLKHGMPHLLGKLTAVGDNGISYAKIVNIVLVSVHDPDMVREILAFPEAIASR